MNTKSGDSDIIKQAGDLADNNESTKQESFGLDNLVRDLAPEDLTDPGAIKMLLLRLDRLRFEKQGLTNKLATFHEIDKKLAVAQSQLKESVRSSLFERTSLAIGGVLIGVCPALGELGDVRYVILVGGIVLVAFAYSSPLLQLLKKGDD